MDIIIDNVSKSFGEKTVLKEFSAIIKENITTCIMGPSGRGKTTLMNLIMGLSKPDKGSIRGVPDKKSAVFQEDRLCESFDAISNIRLVCHKDVSDGNIREHINKIGLGDSMYNPVIELSGGMRRRVTLARALLAKSDIIFLDEPFKGLDEEMKLSVIDYVKENIWDRTVIMVTHDEDEVAMMEGELLRL